MFLKIRKLLLSTFLMFCLLFLAACGSYAGMVKQITAPLSYSVKPAPSSPPAADVPSLYCQVGRGAAKFEQDWYDFEDSSFTLPRGGRVKVKLSRLHHAEEAAIQAFFDGKGQKLVFCPVIATSSSKRVACASLYALEDDLQEGIKRTFDIPAAIRGGVITCAYRQQSLPPLETPLAGGN